MADVTRDNIETLLADAQSDNGTVRHKAVDELRMLLTRPASQSDGELLKRLEKYEKEARDMAENCEAVAVAFADQMKAFEDRTGHNVYAVRMAVDHRNSAKREKQLADDMAAVLARMRGAAVPEVP